MDTSAFSLSAFSARSLCVRCAASLALAAAVLIVAPFASAAKADKAEKRAAKREAAMASPSTAATKPADASTDAAGKGKVKPTPEVAQAKSLDRLREKLEVADDSEWSVIQTRIARVEEVQRTLWATGVNNRGGLNLTDKPKGPTATAANPERESIRAAVTDKMPDAEIKSRLSRAHEIQQQNEAQLAKAQSELRAVLSVRQEAIVVVAGLLPP